MFATFFGIFIRYSDCRTLARVESAVHPNVGITHYTDVYL